MFEIKTKRTSKERKNSKNFFKFDSGCTVFSKNTSRSVKDQLTKLGWLISGFITKGEKLKFKTPCLTWWQVLSKNQRAPSNREKLQQCFKFSFWVQFLTEHTPKSAKHQFTKLFQLSSGAIREGAKTNFKLPI